MWKSIPEATYLFEMHDPSRWDPDMTDDAKKKLVTPTDYKNQGVVLPIKELQDEFGLIFTNSIAWMISYAIHIKKFDEIIVLGVDMTSWSEYGPQRDGIFFLFGFAYKSKIKITVPPNSKLNIWGKTYGWI